MGTREGTTQDGAELMVCVMWPSAGGHSGDPWRPGWTPGPDHGLHRDPISRPEYDGPACHYHPGVFPGIPPPGGKGAPIISHSPLHYGYSYKVIQSDESRYICSYIYPWLIYISKQENMKFRWFSKCCEIQMNIEFAGFFSSVLMSVELAGFLSSVLISVELAVFFSSVLMCV